ncbi:MAG: hypothetical protein QXH37_00925, partial [Candidatus Bathyarchaeia archaeon]
ATQRWVEYHYGSTSWTSEHKPVMDVSDEDWDQYCVFSERVEDLTTGEVLIRGVDYDFSVDSDGYATITGLTSTHYYKILYSTDTVYGYEGDMDFEFDAIETQASQGYILKDGEWELSYEWEDWLGAYHSIALGGTITIRNVTEITGNHTWTYEDSINPYAYDVKVFKEDVATVLGVEGLNLPPENMTDEGNVTEISIFNIWGWWDVEGPEGLDLHIDYLDIVVTWNVTIDYNAATNNYTVTLLITLTPYEENDYLYLEHIPGRYEWTIVGRDAASVDSAGAALVTAAFKNKQVEIGLAGADMYDPLPYNQMPWVMNKFGTDDERADYYYSGTDYRTALKDDWCTTWPISSSNMIGVGGPLANVLAYYGNDFAQAIFGLDDFTDYADWEEVIIPLTCWDITKTQAYASSNETGYAVISTYKDINGTVLFLVWGHWGRDTFYASKWFHEEGIYQLQDAPDGLTAIILEISYESSSEGYKPTGFSIVECLGTISETEWIHGLETKGGFHDP